MHLFVTSFGFEIQTKKVHVINQFLPVFAEIQQFPFYPRVDDVLQFQQLVKAATLQDESL